MTNEQRATKAIEVGKKRARTHFDKLGNHTEVHLSERKLASLLTLAYFQGRLEEAATPRQSRIKGILSGYKLD